MAAPSANTVKVTLSFLAIGLSGVLLFSMYGPRGCNNEEENTLLTQLNQLPEMKEKGGHIEEVTRDVDEDGEDDDVYRFDAEILNRDGVVIGHLRGGRVAGFGTMTPRFHWYATPGVPEEMPERRSGRRGSRDGSGGGERRGDRPPSTPRSE